MLHLVLFEDLYFLQDGGLIWRSQSQLLPRSLLPDCFGVLDWHFKMSLRESESSMIYLKWKSRDLGAILLLGMPSPALQIWLS